MYIQVPPPEILHAHRTLRPLDLNNISLVVHPYLCNLPDRVCNVVPQSHSRFRMSLLRPWNIHATAARRLPHPQLCQRMVLPSCLPCWASPSLPAAMSSRHHISSVHPADANIINMCVLLPQATLLAILNPKQQFLPPDHLHKLDSFSMVPTVSGRKRQLWHCILTSSTASQPF